MDHLDIVAEILVLLELGADLGFVAVEHEAQRRVAAARAGSAGDHRRRSAVSSHCVNGDAWAVSHSRPLVLAAAQASVETISRPL